MPELIDREQAGKNICKYCASGAYCKEDDCMVYQGLRDTPTIQIDPEVRHGRWIELPKALNADEEPCKCSVCGHCLSFYNHYPKSKFCPNCGAKMYADSIAERRAAADAYEMQIGEKKVNFVGFQTQEFIESGKE